MDTSCFHILPIMNNAKLSMRVQISFWDLDFISFDIYPEVGLLDHMVVPFLVFGGISVLFSTMAAPNYIPTIGIQCSLFSTFLPTILIFCLPGNSHSNRFEMISYCDFDLHIPDDSEVEYLFIYLLAICMPSLEKCLFRSLVHFIFHQVICLILFLYSVVKVPYIFWILTRYQIHGLQIFLPFCRLHFHSHFILLRYNWHIPLY